MNNQRPLYIQYSYRDSHSFQSVILSLRPVSLNKFYLLQAGDFRMKNERILKNWVNLGGVCGLCLIMRGCTASEQVVWVVCGYTAVFVDVQMLRVVWVYVSGVSFLSLALTNMSLTICSFFSAMRGGVGNSWFSRGSLLTSSQIR